MSSIGIVTGGKFPGSPVGLATSGKFDTSLRARVVRVIKRFVSKIADYSFISKNK